MRNRTDPGLDYLRTEKVRSDFDEIARLAGVGASSTDRYDRFLLSLIPEDSIDVLDVGCGLGRLSSQIATDNRNVIGIDLSPAMIERASRNVPSSVTLVCGDFLREDFRGQKFDLIISAATLHHMDQVHAVSRMLNLLRPGGRLIIHDMRTDETLTDWAKSAAGLMAMIASRLVQEGRLRDPRALREAWKRHGDGEVYLTLREAKLLADRLLPDAQVFNHWMWRYTIVWDKLE